MIIEKNIVDKDSAGSEQNHSRRLLFLKRTQRFYRFCDQLIQRPA